MKKIITVLMLIGMMGVSMPTEAASWPIRQQAVKNQRMSVKLGKKTMKKLKKASKTVNAKLSRKAYGS